MLQLVQYTTQFMAMLSLYVYFVTFESKGCAASQAVTLVPMHEIAHSLGVVFLGTLAYVYKKKETTSQVIFVWQAIQKVTLNFL